MVCKKENGILIQCDECILDIKNTIEQKKHFKIKNIKNSTEKNRNVILEFIIRTLYRLKDFNRIPNFSREEVTTSILEAGQFSEEEINLIFNKYAYETTDYSEEFLNINGINLRDLSLASIESLGKPSYEWPYPKEIKYNFPFSDCDYTIYLGLCRANPEILKCPDCGREISNTPSNVTFGHDQSLVCPVCINKREDEFDMKGLVMPGNPMHHGIWDTQKPDFLFDNADYFMIAHPKCKKSERSDGKGPMIVNGIWFDSSGRLVLGLECAYCGARNALKPFIKNKEIPLLDESGSKWKRIESPILQAIQKGEGNRVEFKSYLLSNPYGGENSRRQPDKIVRAICSFLNFEGGTLLIGVGDNKQIIGIEHEYSNFGINKDNADGYQNKLTEIIKNKTSPYFLKFIDINFETIDAHEVCLVDIKKADGPCYFQNKLVVRLPGSTVEYTGQEAYNYARAHWP